MHSLEKIIQRNGESIQETREWQEMALAIRTPDAADWALHNHVERTLPDYLAKMNRIDAERLAPWNEHPEPDTGDADDVNEHIAMQLATFDGEGRPRAFFHGSASDFTSFDFDHPNRKDQGWLGRGAYVTSDPEIAEGYSRLKSGPVGENVMPLYVAIHNPIMADAKTKQMFRTRSKETIDKWTDEMIARGWDGVIMPFSDGHVEIVAFNKTAVKSSSGNSGAFSATNPDIRNVSRREGRRAIL